MTSRINSESLRFFVISRVSYDEFPHFKTSVLIFLLATECEYNLKTIFARKEGPMLGES